MQTNINPNILKSIQILLCGLFIQSAVYAAEVGSSFSYQGQLLDQGQPANQKYDIRILAYHQETGGAVQMEVDFIDVIVNNGLFTIPEVDLGDSLFQGDEVWLELEVSIAGNDNFETLAPRQRISAAPYAVQAEFLSANGASTDDVLQFDGNNWVPQAIQVDSYWSTHTSNPDAIHYNDGDVGIGSIYPSAKLHIFGSVGNEAFIVNVGNQQKMIVSNNGGLSVGAPIAAPIDGLRVQGNTQLQGDTQQPVASNGMMKYMVHAFCAGTNSLLIKSYNGVDSGSAFALGSGTGACTIAFPIDIHNRFWQATAVLPSDSERRAVSCKLSSSSNSSLDCELFKASSGNLKNGQIMVLIY
jgi:hypothetical protein